MKNHLKASLISYSCGPSDELSILHVILRNASDYH